MLSPVSAGVSVNDIVILSFEFSDLENQDSAERIPQFLQMWMAPSGIITDCRCIP